MRCTRCNEPIEGAPARRPDGREYHPECYLAIRREAKAIVRLALGAACPDPAPEPEMGAFAIEDGWVAIPGFPDYDAHPTTGRVRTWARRGPKARAEAQRPRLDEPRELAAASYGTGSVQECFQLRDAAGVRRKVPRGRILALVALACLEVA